MHLTRSTSLLALAVTTLALVGCAPDGTSSAGTSQAHATTPGSGAVAPGADRGQAGQTAPLQNAFPPAALLIAKDLPLLPAPGLAGAVRPPETVRAVYEFAARRPEVLKYVPCFCGCEQSGHVGNDDCFVSGRDAAGKVREWEPHGLVCEVCIDVGQMAMQMFNGGASLASIRDAVEKKFAGSHGNRHTPTPQPPRKTGTHD